MLKKDINKMSIFKDILTDIEKLSWKDDIFLSENKNDWNLYSRCLIINIDNLSDEEILKLTIQNKLIHVMNISTLQEIICNAYQQNDKCTLNDLFNAFLYYYNNDAFIDFSTQK